MSEQQKLKMKNYQQARVNMHTATQPQRHNHDKSASSEGIIFLHAGLVWLSCTEDYNIFNFMFK